MTALRWAAAWAADTDSPIDLIHACDDVALDESVLEDFPDEIAPAVKAYRERIADDRAKLEAKLAGQCEGIEAPCSARFIPDTPWRALVDASEADDVDCLVVGPHADGLRILGTTAGRIVRHAACPVLVCEGSTQPPKSFKGTKWLFGVDTEAENAAKVIEDARAIAARQGAELVLFHALPAAVTAGAPGLVETWTRDAEKALSRYVEGGHVAGVKVAFGNPAHQMVSIAEADDEIVLVVLATHGRKGLARIALGSVAEKVVREARVPCLVLRGGDE